MATCGSVATSWHRFEFERAWQLAMTVNFCA
jgi:hypothetical protein